MTHDLFTHGENSVRQQAQLRALARTPPSGGNLILVTHDATIAAFTRISPCTGEAVIGTFDAGSRFRVAGRFAPPE